MKIFKSQPYYQDRGAMTSLEDFKDDEGKIDFLKTENIWFIDRIRAKLFYTQAKLRSELEVSEEGSNINSELKASLEELEESLIQLNTMDDLLHRRGEMPWDQN